MGSQNQDPRRPGQDQNAGSRGGARVGQPGEQQRTSQQNAGSTEGGGTRNAGNSVERITEDSREGNSIESITDDGGAGRESQAGARTGRSGDGSGEQDIERAAGKQKGVETPGSRPR